MRVHLLIVLLLLAPLAAATTTVIKPYTGTSTRDPLLGAHAVCDIGGPGGPNVGGACFDVPSGMGSPFVTVHDDRSIGLVQVSIFSYVGDVGLPIDGKVFCARTDRPFYASMQVGTRLVISVGPTNGGDQTPCPGLPGTTGTLKLQWG